MTHACPQCGRPTLPPAVNPTSYRFCVKCGHRFNPGDAVKRTQPFSASQEAE